MKELLITFAILLLLLTLLSTFGGAIRPNENFYQSSSPSYPTSYSERYMNQMSEMNEMNGNMPSNDRERYMNQMSEMNEMNGNMPSNDRERYMNGSMPSYPTSYSERYINQLSQGSAAAMPATTMPATTMPATTMPATTMPATTMPATTMPATTMPSTTMPATTMPATTMPQVSSVAPSVNVQDSIQERFYNNMPTAYMNEPFDSTPADIHYSEYYANNSSLNNIPSTSAASINNMMQTPTGSTNISEGFAIAPFESEESNYSSF